MALRIRLWLQPVVLLLLATTLTLVAFDRPLIRGDGVAYLAWANTILLDHDVDLSNQAEQLKPLNTAGQIVYDQNRQRWVSVFPFGTAIIQAPAYLLGHLFSQQGWLNINPDYFLQMQGVPFPYSMFVMLEANLMALASAVMAWKLARRVCDTMTSAVVAFAVFLGTPLVYYSTIEPMYSHNSGTFTLTCFLFILARASWDRLDIRWYEWIFLGFVAGLTVLIRWQLMLVFVPAWILLAWERRWKGIALATACAALTLIPLPLVWHEMYGQWLVIPYEAATSSSFFQSPLVGLWGVTRQLLVNSPIVLFSLLGFPTLWKLNRSWTLMIAGMIGLQILINGAVLDWWAGNSYGMRRMSELYPIYVLLAGSAAGWAISRETGHWQLTRPLVRGIFLLMVAYNFLYILAFFHFTWTNTAGVFADEPTVMLRFLLDRPRVFRWQLMDAVLKAHLGPPAWTQPGP